MLKCGRNLHTGKLCIPHTFPMSIYLWNFTSSKWLSIPPLKVLPPLPPTHKPVSLTLVPILMTSLAYCSISSEFTWKLPLACKKKAATTVQGLIATLVHERATTTERKVNGQQRLHCGSIRTGAQYLCSVSNYCTAHLVSYRKQWLHRTIISAVWHSNVQRQNEVIVCSTVQKPAGPTITYIIMYGILCNQQMGSG